MMKNNYEIPSLAKACRLLQLVAEHQGEWTATELARAIETPRTTCFRMLQTLAQEKLILADGKSYRLGPGLVRLGLKTLEGLPIRRLCVPVLRELSRSLGETVHLAILCDDRSLLLEVCDAPHSQRISSRPGSLVWLHASATGKVLLAHLDDSRRAELFSRLEMPALTPRSLTRPELLAAQFPAILAAGYAMDDEEYIHDGRCLAVPVRNAAGEVIAAIGMTSSPSRLPESAIAAAVSRLQEGSRILSFNLPGSEEPAIKLKKPRKKRGEG
ncbi:MAG: Transcriptional regulator KdgR [Verrucomicrobiota bacterium]|jgi:IclR family acetate operon transcriptional repressor